MPLNHFDPKILASLSSVALRSRHLAEGLRSGEHRGARQGLAVEFSQLRPYCAGDELKRIDWKVYGRTDKFQIRQYQEEVELNVYLVLDATASMSYSGYKIRKQPGLSKFDYAALLAVANAYLTLRQNDTVQLATVGRSTKPEPEFRSVDQWNAFLNSLEENITQNQLPSGNAPLADSLLELASRWKSRGLFIVFSDLLDDWEPLAGALKRIRLAGHDCCVYHVLDRDELDFPFSNRTRFDFLEPGTVKWDAGTPRNGSNLEGEASLLQDAYRAEIQKFLSQAAQTCQNYEIDYRLAITDRPLDEPIRRFNVYAQETGQTGGSV